MCRNAVKTGRLAFEIVRIAFLTSLVLATLVASTGCSSHPHQTKATQLPTGGVSLTILDASAERIDANHAFLVFCEAALDNHTGAPLTVRSSFSSAFDALTLTVRGEGGRI